MIHPTRENCVAPVNQIYLMENPDPKLQGKYYVFQCDWVPEERWLRWGYSNKPWGQTKREGDTRVAEGIKALTILRHFLGESYEDLEDLNSVYPTAIIECTYFPFPFGQFNRRLLIWEVRDY